MQTKREYAASLGLAVAGARGRLSREAHAAITEAESNGLIFSDASPVKVAPTPRAEKSAKSVTVNAPVIVGEVVGLVGNGDLDALYVGVDSRNKKVTVNARQVCRNSGYSLVGCRCGLSHEVLVSSMETVTVTKKGG